MIRALKNMIKLLSIKFNYSIHIKLNDKRFEIPVIRNIGLVHLYDKDEAWMIQLIRKLLKVNSGTFIDIGTNIGQTLLTLRSVSENENYIGFEPNSSCVFYIRQLIHKNKLKNCRIISVGISCEDSLVEIDLTNETDSGGSMIKDLRPNFQYSEKIMVPVLSFDNIFEKLNIDGINIIKIDVEGAELYVMKGLSDSVKRFRPIIICEVLFAHDCETIIFVRKRNLELKEILNSLNYKIYQIIKTEYNDDIAEFKFCTEFENVTWTVDNKNLCDYLFIPEEKEAIFFKQ